MRKGAIALVAALALCAGVAQAAPAQWAGNGH